MKEIVVYQENVLSPVVIIDEDDSNLTEYSKKISAVLEASNVTILETSSGCVILRPHKITSLLIKEMDIVKSKEIEVKTEEKKEIKTPSPIDEGEDYITDGD